MSKTVGLIPKTKKGGNRKPEQPKDSEKPKDNESKSQ